MKKLLLPLLLASLTLMALLVTISLLRVSANPLQAADGDLVFIDSGQALGNSSSRDVALADLDDDGDLDAFVANAGTANRVWLNNGNGIFSDSGQSLGTGASYGVALGKLNNDEHLDAFIANYNEPNRVWLNDGDGFFSITNQALGSAPSNDVALANLDGDTDLDAFVANGSASNKANKVWWNTGNGVFSDSGQNLGTSWSEAVALGKLDGDGDVDAFVANGTASQLPDKIYLNNGGVFSDSGQSLYSGWTYDVALAQLDGDQHLDAFVASWFPPANKVWINDGNGNFGDSGQSLGNVASTSVALADVDDDNDVDALVGNWFPEDNEIWLNDANGNFTNSGLGLGIGATWSVALGDLDGDGDPDAFIANEGPNEVWINGQLGLPGAIFQVDRQTNNDGKEVFYSATGGAAMLPIVLGQPITQTIWVHARIDSTSGVVTETIPFSPGQPLKFLNLVNPNPDPSEELVLTLFVTLPGDTPVAGNHTDMLSFFFVDGGQTPDDCLLCFNEWLARLLGFDPIFGALHHLSLPEQKASAQWRYYTLLFDIYTPEMRDIVATHPAVLWDVLTTLDGWTDPLQDLDDGNGASVTITQSMVDNGIELLGGIKDEASPGLAAVITHEQNAVDMPSFVGLNMEQAWDEVVARRPIQELYVTVIVK